MEYSLAIQSNTLLTNAKEKYSKSLKKSCRVNEDSRKCIVFDSIYMNSRKTRKLEKKKTSP